MCVNVVETKVQMQNWSSFPSLLLCRLWPFKFPLPLPYLWIT